MQLCPANEKAFAASRVAASSRSASAATMTGVAFPSSRLTRLRGCSLAQLPAGRNRAREGDELHALVLDEHVADLGRRAADDVQPACGQPRFGLELGQEEGGQRGLLRGLEDDGAACGERRRDLVRDEVEREVERGDRSDDPDRLPESERELSLARGRGVHRHHVPGELARLDRRHREGRDCAGGLDAGGFHRLARLGGDRASRVVCALAQKCRDPIEDRCTLVGRQRARASPARLRRARLAPGVRRPSAHVRRALRRRATAPRSTRRSRPTHLRRGACARPWSWPWRECRWETFAVDMPDVRYARSGAVSGRISGRGRSGRRARAEGRSGSMAPLCCSRWLGMRTSSTPSARRSGGGTARSRRSVRRSSRRRS